MPPSSGDPRKRAKKTTKPANFVPGDDKYEVTAWGGAGGTEDLPLPSGQLCLARRVGIQGLLEAGIIHDIDPLMGFIQQHQARVEGKPTADPNEAIWDVLKDDAKRTAIFHLLDRIVCSVVIKPHVEMAPNDITRRKDGVIYTDMVEITDKMHIMTWTIGGAEKLVSFREGFEAHVDRLSTEQEHGDETQ